jgi:hypothetical protein
MFYDITSKTNILYKGWRKYKLVVRKTVKNVQLSGGDVQTLLIRVLINNYQLKHIIMLNKIFSG